MGSWLLSRNPKWDMNTNHPPSLIAAAHADGMYASPRRWSHSRDLSWWTRMGLVVCPHASNRSRDKTGIPQMWLTQAEAPHAKEIALPTQWISLMVNSIMSFCVSSFATLYTVPAVISIIVSLYQSPLIASWNICTVLYNLYYSKRVWLYSLHSEPQELQYQWLITQACITHTLDDE